MATDPLAHLTPADRARYTVFHNAVVTCTRLYNEEPTAARLRDLGEWIEAGLPPRIAPPAADLAPIDAPEQVAQPVQTDTPPLSAVPAATLLVVEAGGEGAGGFDNGERLDALCNHLRAHRGWIERTGEELFVRYAAWADSPVVAAERNRMVLAVYGELAEVLEALPVGRYGWQGLHQALTTPEKTEG